MRDLYDPSDPYGFSHEMLRKEYRDFMGNRVGINGQSASRAKRTLHKSSFPMKLGYLIENNPFASTFDAESASGAKGSALQEVSKSHVNDIPKVGRVERLAINAKCLYTTRYKEVTNLIEEIEHNQNVITHLSDLSPDSVLPLSIVSTAPPSPSIQVNSQIEVMPLNETLIPAAPDAQGEAEATGTTPTPTSSAKEAPSPMPACFSVEPVLRPWNASRAWEKQFEAFSPLDVDLLDRVKYMFASYNRSIKALPFLKQKPVPTCLCRCTYQHSIAIYELAHFIGIGQQ